MQNPTALSSLLLTYARYMKSRVIRCGNIDVTQKMLIRFARSQVLYILSVAYYNDAENVINLKKIKLIEVYKMDAGELYSWEKSNEHVIHGWIWIKIPSKNTP